MSTFKFPQCPPQLKNVQHYLKLALDYDVREPAISYWARLYALQSALKIDRKSPEAKILLTALMDWLESFKKQHANNESITNDVAGQAVLENEAHKLFTRADADDRAANFSKNVVKMFYTAGILFDVIEVFGELTEEISAQRKYSKWKATYIHNCLKNGETPVPGPMGGEEPFNFGSIGDDNQEHMHQDTGTGTVGIGFNLPTVPVPEDPQQTHFPAVNQVPTHIEYPPAGGVKVLPQIPSAENPPRPGGVNLTPECYTKAQKFCKYAISSLDYEDSPTAISYLTKALNLLTTGRES